MTEQYLFRLFIKLFIAIHLINNFLPVTIPSSNKDNRINDKIKQIQNKINSLIASKIEAFCPSPVISLFHK